MKIEPDGKRTWMCERCNKTFISRKGSIIHQRTHTGERPYSCKICEKSFIDSSTLMKHQVIHQAVRPFTCATCFRGFNQKVALQRHERTHTQQSLFVCKYCPKTFLVLSSLQAHEKIHSGIKPYICRFCPSSFHTSTAQRQHERVHTNERPYQCNYCPKAFKDSGTLFKHQVIHSGIKPFICPLCSQGFTQKVALRKHIRSHVMRLLSNICEICNKEYRSKDDLSCHLETHVEVHPRIFDVRSVATSSLKNPRNIVLFPKNPESDLSDLTTLCDVAISTSVHFLSPRSDKKSNSGYQYSCTQCGMAFRRQKSLNSHLSVHKVACKYCDKVFNDRGILKAHEKHLCTASVNTTALSVPIKPGTKFKTGKRQFYCEKCLKSFSSRNGYVIHQRSHTGERPYGCRWCQKAFGDSATRHKHERIHTGERPFKCTHCPRAFNQRAALRAHQVTHSIDRAYLCHYCPSSFPYAATLRKHIEACHTDSIIVTCPLCDTMNNCKIRQLYKHINTSHLLNNDAKMCTLCDSGAFTDSGEFCDHLIWHAKQHAFIINHNTGNENLKSVQTKAKKIVKNNLVKLKQLNGETHNCFGCKNI